MARSASGRGGLEGAANVVVVHGEAAGGGGAKGCKAIPGSPGNAAMLKMKGIIIIFGASGAVKLLKDASPGNGGFLAAVGSPCLD